MKVLTSEVTRAVPGAHFPTEAQSRPVSIDSLAFGWECRDLKFSIEWEHSCKGYSKLTFDGARSEFRIKIFGEDDTRIVVIRAAEVRWTSAGIDAFFQPTIFFSLYNAPSYETESAVDSVQSMMEQSDIQSPSSPGRSTHRQRWSAIDPNHAEIAPYTSNAIRLECPKPSDIETYRLLCKFAHLRVHTFLYPVVNRGLFSKNNRDRIFIWLPKLPIKVAFQIEALTRNLVVDFTEIFGLRPNIERMILERGEDFVVAFLRQFGLYLQSWLDQDDVQSFTQAGSVQDQWAQCLAEFTPLQKKKKNNNKPKSTSRDSSSSDLPNDDIFECFHVTQTPTTMRLDGPFPERSNRVIRSYPENHDSFLRVSFTDEINLHYRFDREVDGKSFIQDRVGNTLANGLWIAGHHFKFLAFSLSSLKMHTVWFVKDFVDRKGRRVCADSIIRSLGKFDQVPHDPLLMYCPARYGARISQAFTATDSSVVVEAEEIFVIDDIKDSTKKHCFTDGYGTISFELAQEIWKKISTPTFPHAYQIRLMGTKGVVGIDYKLTGRAICVRPSMIKFDAPNSRQVEIAQYFNKATRFYLNRPLIMLLEGLGVPYKSFEALQKAALMDVQQSMESLERAARLFETFGLGTSFRLTSIMLSLHKLGVDALTGDRFWLRMMDFAMNHVLRDIKHRAHIPVPSGWNLVGVADVHGWLQEGEIFVHVVPSSSGNGPPGLEQNIYLKGPTMVSRSPTIHPGDVQVVNAIGKPPPGSPFEKESFPNCIVFSTKGKRPLPSYLGGGDLDGDTYCCTTLPSLRPKLEETFPPAEYNPARRLMLNRPSTMQDVADFVTEYIYSDSVGIIATNWLIIADQSPLAIHDPDCLQLAALHNAAVDYQKTGRPVPLDEIPRLRRSAKPDWSAPETSVTKDRTRYYESQTAIGKLCRAVDLPALKTVGRTQRDQQRLLQEGRRQRVTLQDILGAFKDMEPDEGDDVWKAVRAQVYTWGSFSTIPEYDEELITEMWTLFEYYASRLKSICAGHTLFYSPRSAAMLTEEEAVVGTIVAKCSQRRKRKDLIERMREQTAALARDVGKQISGEEGTLPVVSLERGWVAYRVACMEGVSFGANSLAWLAMGEIFDAIKVLEEESML